MVELSSKLLFLFLLVIGYCSVEGKARIWIVAQLRKI